MDENARGPFDPQMVLIEWFTTRTERRQLRWKVEAEAMTASVSLPPLIHLRFATCRIAGNKCVRWNSFYVRRDNDEALFGFDSNAAPDDSATFTALNALFITALETAMATI